MPHLVRTLAKSAFRVFKRNRSILDFCSTSKFSTSSNLNFQFSKMAAVKREFYIVPNDTPVVPLDCVEAFKGLTDQEKKYAHFIARASAEGALICPVQISPESPVLFAVLHQLFSNESVETAKTRALASGWTEQEFTALLAFTSNFFGNSSNFKGFGDTKMVPDVDKQKFSKFLESSVAFAKNPKLTILWKEVEDLVFSLEPNKLALGFGSEGVTTYLTSNITKSDAEMVDRYLNGKKFETWNSRLIKTEKDGKTVFTVLLASINAAVFSTEEFEGVTIVIRSGDYSPLLANLNKQLVQAIPFAANENQKKMLQKYIEHFENGKLDDHKDGSRYWIKDVNPAVESYIGFIENYRDPAGTRAEFEGFVSAVNKETSKKFQNLVAGAEEFLKRLPWGPDYEKDKFLKPDFTALDVIYFGSHGIPAGINIPNYDEIRQSEGFKNVSLGNVISAIPKQKIEFLTKEDEELFKKYFKESFEVQVGLHELLGHGSGKLFQFDGEKFNFDKNSVKHLLTGEPITTWYDKGETWSSKFGGLSNAYEECRAEAVGYYLSCYPDILKVFGHEGQVAEDVKYTNWLNEIRAGLVGLEFYQPEIKKWGQAHCCARYVLFRVAMHAGQGFVTIQETVGEDGAPDLLFKLDRSKIDSVGKPAIGSFLKTLQAYKSTGDANGGIKMFSEWSVVGEEQLRWREIVIARRKPRRVFVQPNTVLNNDSKVELKTYPETFEGVIQSFVERHSEKSILDLLTVWENSRSLGF